MLVACPSTNVRMCSDRRMPVQPLIRYQALSRWRSIRMNTGSTGLRLQVPMGWSWFTTSAPGILFSFRSLSRRHSAEIVKTIPLYYDVWEILDTYMFSVMKSTFSTRPYLALRGSRPGQFGAPFHDYSVTPKASRSSKKGLVRISYIFSTMHQFFPRKMTHDHIIDETFIKPT